MPEDSILWVVTVNLVIWTGLFLYLLKIEKQLHKMENDDE